MVTVYSRAANVSLYKSTACSQATLFLIALSAAVVVLPAFVVYHTHGSRDAPLVGYTREQILGHLDFVYCRTMESCATEKCYYLFVIDRGDTRILSDLEGLWRRVDIFTEQPKIDFKKDFILLLDTRDGDVIFTSHPQQEGRLGSTMPIVRFTHSPTDTNLDLRPERHDIRFVIDTANITGIRLLLKMEARLQTMAGVMSNCLVYIEHSSALVGSSFSATSDLRVTSSFVIPFRSYNDLRTLPDFTQPLEQILEEHSKSKVKCVLEGTTKVWRPTTRSSATSDRFTLSLRLNTAEQTFNYRPGLSHILKLGWMQYLSVMVIFAGLAIKLERYVFENQIIATYCSDSHPYYNKH